MNNSTRPQLIIIGGPNGSGKTTLAEILVDQTSLGRYINADVIAAGMSLHSDLSKRLEINAGRILISEVSSAIRAKQSISFESTLAGRGWLTHISAARNAGFEVYLLFVAVHSSEISVERVKARVAEGGHNIPTNTIVRRFPRSIRNFFSLYSKAADSWYFFDNSNSRGRLIAQYEDQEISIMNEPVFGEYKKI